LTTYATTGERYNSGKLRAIAVASLMRVESLPNVPTVDEQGYRGYEVDIWYGLVAPARTPKDTIAQLTDWLTAAMKVPEIHAKLAVQGLNPDSMCGADFNNLFRRQYDDYSRVIREANIKAE
jgi:tripartite-type tricarboxylate transporter receptor subunit TctC